MAAVAAVVDADRPSSSADSTQGWGAYVYERIKAFATSAVRFSVKAYDIEIDTFVADRAPSTEAAKYLKGETGFSLEPDLRWGDYEYGRGARVPAYDPSTATRNACCVYPFCCFPFCCQLRCCRKCCGGCCGRCNEPLKKCADRHAKKPRWFSSFLFHYPVAFDFFIESNRSRVLALSNLVLCLLLIIFCLNPLASKFEGSLSCFASFGYRPFFMQTASISPSYGNWLAINSVNGLPDAFAMGMAASPYKPMPEIITYTRLPQPAGPAGKKNCTGTDRVYNAMYYNDYSSNNIMYCVSCASSAAGCELSHMIRSVADIRTCATKSGRCGTCSNVVFGSSLGGPGHNQMAHFSATFQQLFYRPLLVAAANTRMNRFVGWGGLAWAGSILNTISLIGTWTNDLEYCTPQLRGSLDLMLQGPEKGGVTNGSISKAEVDIVASELKANYSSIPWAFTDTQLHGSINQIQTSYSKPTYEKVSAALLKRGFRKVHFKLDANGKPTKCYDTVKKGKCDSAWSGTTELTIASARSGLRIMQTSRKYMQDIIWPSAISSLFSIPIDSCGKTTTSPTVDPVTTTTTTTTTTTPPTAGGIDRSCCTAAASNDGDYDCRCRDGSCWYAGDVQSGIVFPSSNWNKEGKTCKTKEATTTTTVAPTTSDESTSEAAAINKTGSSSESSPGICVNEEMSFPPGYLKVRKRGLCVRLHTGSGAFSFNGEV